jgi:hypothetical protein
MDIIDNMVAQMVLIQSGGLLEVVFTLFLIYKN